MSTSDDTTIPPLKRCSRCQQDKPATREFFKLDNRAKSGLNAYCKVCASDLERERRIKGGENIRQKRRENRQKNLSRVREQAADRRKRNREKVLDQNHKSYQRHRASRLERNRLWRQNNKAKIQPRAVINTRNRRARKKGLPESLTIEEWQRCLEYFNYRCAVCGRPQGLWHTVAADHWIALTDTRPDNPGTVAWNIIPLCHGDDGCNNSKCNRDAGEWLEWKFGTKRAAQILLRIETYLDQARR